MEGAGLQGQSECGLVGVCDITDPAPFTRRPRPTDDHAPRRLLPLGLQLLALGLLGAGLAVLGWFRGGA